MFWCKKCVTPSTRPRLQFDKNGVCNACNWHEEKQRINWAVKRRELIEICDKFRSNDSWFDCIVPCSGGKDGSYIAYKLKNDYKMNPICITFAPQIQTWLGKRNLDNFRNSGFYHILITPNSDQYRRYSKDYFIEKGMPKQPFVVGISSALIQYALKFNIKLIVYGEQGEIEYGGDQSTFGLKKFDRDFLKNIYYEGQNPSVYGPLWKMPDEKELSKLYCTWWSLFEDWDPQKHARFAKDYCGLEMMVGGSIGTFTNYSQLDDVMQDLHTFLQFCKFGFGRCTSDASIEIRRNRMVREQGIEVVNKIDGQYPLEYHEAYLDYFNMTEKRYWETIESHVNWEILKRSGKKEKPYILRGKVR